MVRKRGLSDGNVGSPNFTPEGTPSTSKADEYSSSGIHSLRHKRKKLLKDGRLHDVVDYSDLFSVTNLKKELEGGKYGSVTKDIEDLCVRRSQFLSSVKKLSPILSSCRQGLFLQSPKSGGLHTHYPLDVQSKQATKLAHGHISQLAIRKLVELDDDCVEIDALEAKISESPSKSGAGECKKSPNVEKNPPADNRLVIVLDSDEEESEEHGGTAQASRRDLEALHSETPEPSQLQRSHSLDLDGRITHLGTTSDALNSEVPQSTESQRHHTLDFDGLITRLHMSPDALNSEVPELTESQRPHTQDPDGLIAQLDTTSDALSSEVPQSTESQRPHTQDLDALTTSADTTSNDLKPEFLQEAQPRRLHNSDLDGLITHSGTTPKAVEDNQDGSNKHVTETVRKVVFDANRKASFCHQKVMLEKPINDKDFTDRNGRKGRVVREEQKILKAETDTATSKGVYVGVQDDLPSTTSGVEGDTDDGLQDIWREMTLAYECSKATSGETVEHSEDEEAEECDHFFLLKDDLGYVCRVCGVIKQSIETIFDYQWIKGSKTTRTYMSEARNRTQKEENDAASFSGLIISHELAAVDVSPHPRHMKQMKPHQLQGFNFLCQNLISDDPGGCVLAHAPGSGKTFLIISFIQSFLAKYSQARPLIVLPKGILGTWKKEFIKWQVEDVPLYDFYSSKANNRREQLDILREWVEHRGILFLGYKQFANIVSNSDCSKTAASCHDILVEVPTVLIMDEGHTARTEETDILNSLANVKTPRKVILSGTLFQNSVKEVFTILNLVRPKFLSSDASKTIKRRIMSKALIPSGKRQLRTGGDMSFFDVVKETLQNDENVNRQVAVIQDLRDMTRNVLHYYRGENLDDLPGLVDLTVFLNLRPEQKTIVDKLKEKKNILGISSVVSAVYMHPQLERICQDATRGDKGCSFELDKMEGLINKMDVRGGVKTKFFLNMLGLCESCGEKLLVFSQYILPLKFLERYLVKNKCWSPGKEMFMISGDTNTEEREKSMERFNNSSDSKVLFGSIKACGEGISLVGASRILIMDVHHNPSVTRQAIGRAFRPGQMKKVFVYRLVASDSPEEENHHSSRKKELMSKKLFEWSEFCIIPNFEMEAVDIEDSEDQFWESPSLREDVKAVFKR